MISINEVFANSLNSSNAQLLLITLSFLGGVIASISPCSLAMLPVVIGYIGGHPEQKTSHTAVQLLSFVLGSSIVFTIIGIICALTGHVFISFVGDYFMIVIASILMIMGLGLIGVIEIRLPNIINKIPQSKGHSIVLYPILLGATFALAGTPCSTPILAGIMSVASISSSLGIAILMLFFFALGQGVILILAGLFTSIIQHLKKAVEISEILLKISGFILVLASIIFFYKIFSHFFI